MTGLTLALLPVGFSTSLNVTLGHVLYAGCPVTLGFIYGAYGFGATVRLLAAGHSKAWHDYKLLAWVTLVTGGLAAWMFWEDMEAVRRRKMEDRRGSIFAAGVPKNILLMAWFVFAYRAVEVALMGAALGEVAEILMRGGGSGREKNPGRPLSWYWADFGVHGGWLFWAGITVGRIVLLLRGLLRPEGIGYHRTRFLDAPGPVAWILMALLWGPGKHSPLQSLAQGGSFTAGYAMGPVYPIAIIELTQTMGAQELIGGIVIVSAAGGYGAAVMPFVSMALADTPWALQTAVLGLLATMVAICYALPDRPHGC